MVLQDPESLRGHFGSCCIICSLEKQSSKTVCIRGYTGSSLLRSCKTRQPMRFGKIYLTVNEENTHESVTNFLNQAILFWGSVKNISTILNVLSLLAHFRLTRTFQSFVFMWKCRILSSLSCDFCELLRRAPRHQPNKARPL